MSYRDDYDALYERAATLQRDLERAQAELARRDVKSEPVREWHTTSRRPLRELPAAETVLAALIDTFEPKPPPAMPPVHAVVGQIKQVTARRLATLDPEYALLVGAIVEQLVADPTPDLIDDLRSIVRDLRVRRHAVAP